MNRATYDDIGIGYARFRRPDPRINTQIRRALGAAAHVINVGAGTGSYEPPDRFVLAIEPSAEMIRQRPAHAAPCLQGDVDALKMFGDGAFDAAMAVLTVHHWPAPLGGLAELARVANGVVVFTFDPVLHNSFWLFREYIPAMTRLPTTSGAVPVAGVAQTIAADRVETVLIPHDCVDGFGWAYWRRPEMYLRDDVRRCISGFGLVPPAEVNRGIAQLASDLDSGAWAERHADLLEVDEIDGGFRLVIRDMR